jgi:hypothetical protein
MNAEANFTNDEWDLLFELPPLVGTAMMLAGRSGLGSVKEAMAIATSVVGSGREYPDNPIVAHINEMRRDGHRSEVEKLGGSYRGLSPVELRQMALDRFRQARFLVRQKAPAAADEFLKWIVQVGQRVAESAKEGGFLGIGGERVSQEETELLTQLQNEL